MGKLRDQMEQDLRIRRYSKKTRTEYVRCVANFVRHFNKSPDQMGEKEIRSFVVHLVEERKVSPSVQKMHISRPQVLLFKHPQTASSCSTPSLSEGSQAVARCIEPPGSPRCLAQR